MELIRRVAVIVPLLLVYLALALHLGFAERSLHWDTATKFEVTWQVIAGPVLMITESSDIIIVVLLSYLAFMVLMLALAHPILPCIVTGVLSTFGLALWLFWGVAYAFRGV